MGTTHSATSPVCLTVPYHPSISYSSLRSESKWQRQPPVTMQVAVVATSSYRPSTDESIRPSTPSTDESIRPSMEKIEACVRWAAQHVRPSMDESIRELIIDSWLDSGFEIKDGWGFDIQWNPQNRVFRALVLEAEPKRKKSETGPLYLKVDGGMRGYATHHYMCTICQINASQYATVVGMANHLWTRHTTNQHERFKCRTCNKHFPSKLLSEKHLAAHHTELLQETITKEGDNKTGLRLLKPQEYMSSVRKRGRPAIQRPNHATREAKLYRLKRGSDQSSSVSDDEIKSRSKSSMNFSSFFSPPISEIIEADDLPSVRSSKPMIPRLPSVKLSLPPITEIMNAHDMLPGDSTENSRLFDTPTRKGMDMKLTGTRRMEDIW